MKNLNTTPLILPLMLLVMTLKVIVANETRAAEFDQRADVLRAFGRAWDLVVERVGGQQRV